MAEPEAPVEVALTIAARPETIFRYFTDPARFARWMGDGSTLNAAPAGPPADHIGLVQRMAGGARLVGRGAPEPCHGLVRFGWATGFWVPPRDHPNRRSVPDQAGISDRSPCPMAAPPKTRESPRSPADFA